MQLDILGIIFLALLAIFFPRTVLGLVIMVVLLHWIWYIVLSVAIVAFILDVNATK